MTKDVKEVGTIGQMYENRTNHKIGVLESRDEKFKTLLMRDKEGGTFNVTYSTFRSSWRKYAGDEIIETSTQKEEKKSQKEAKAVKAEKVVAEKVEKPTLSQKDKVQMVHAVKDIIEDVVSKEGIAELVKVKFAYRGAIKIKCKRKNALEFWVKYATGDIDIYVADAVKLDSVPKYVDIATKTSWVLKTRYTVSKDNLADIVKKLSVNLKKYSMEVMEDNKKRAKKKEEEN